MPTAKDSLDGPQPVAVRWPTAAPQGEREYFGPETDLFLICCNEKQILP